MRFTIDTDTKTVTLHGSTSFRDIEDLKKLIGNDLEGWSILPDVQQVNPILPLFPYIPPPIYPSFPGTPIWGNPPIITCSASSGTAEVPEVFKPVMGLSMVHREPLLMFVAEYDN